MPLFGRTFLGEAANRVCCQSRVRPLDWTTTSTILCELRDFQNDRAWERLVARFHAPLVSFARKSGLPEADAHDLAQEALAAFADAYRRGEYDRGKGRLSSWLFGIAFRHVLRQRRRLARESKRFQSEADAEMWADLVDEIPSAAIWDREWEACLLRDCVERARREFPEPTFRAFEMVVVEGQRPRSVAGALNVSVKTVYDAKYRVLRRIRQLGSEFEEAS